MDPTLLGDRIVDWWQTRSAKKMTRKKNAMLMQAYLDEINDNPTIPVSCRWEKVDNQSRDFRHRAVETGKPAITSAQANSGGINDFSTCEIASSVQVCDKTT